MSRWFRHYAGMMRDDKLVRVAVRAKQPVERVVWVWGAILESAAEIDDEGRFELDSGEVAYFLRTDEADIGSIVSGLEAEGRLDGPTVAKWGDRQFSSDRAKERQAAYRERKKASEGRLGRLHNDDDAGDSDARVTSRDGVVTPQETETETEEKPETIVSGKKADPRGTRLPGDWQPRALAGKTADMVAAWPVGMLERELSKFRDHFLKTPGVRGRSLDWDASLRNWLRTADERKPRNGILSQPSLRGTRPDPALDLLRAAEAAERQDRTSDCGTRLALPSGGSG